MVSIRAIALFIAIITGANAAQGTVPVVIGTGAGRLAVMNMVTNAEDQLNSGDIAGAKRNVDAALHADRKLCPAFYVRAKIFARQGKYELAIQDCNEALRLYPGFVTETGDFDSAVRAQHRPWQ